MAEQANPRLRDEEAKSAEEESKPSSKPAFWARFLTRKWIAILLGVSIIVQGLGFTYYQLLRKARAARPSPEVSLGTFQFEADRTELGEVAGAEFSLYIALLEHVDQQARQRLTARKFRVQQDIEELLRQSHSGDFDDPNLRGLKRQLQERVNETLGMRAIADVIITDLKLKQSDKEVEPVTNTADTSPWMEKPSS